MKNLQKSLEFVASHYSTDLKNLLVDLFSKPVRVPHSMMDEVFSKYAFRFFREIELLHKFVHHSLPISLFLSYCVLNSVTLICWTLS